jgi:hypothetical protein
MKTLLSLLALSTLIIFSLFINSVSSNQIIFGPKTYTRQSGPPSIITDTFSAIPSSNYKLVLTNNGVSDAAEEAVSDSFIYLNDESIVGANNFNQSTSSLEVAVTLQASNKLEVEVRGNTGGSITVEIVTTP